MNVQFLHGKAELGLSGEILMAWAVGLFTLTLWMAFTPYLALEQARQLAFCLTGLFVGYSLSRVERIRHKVALVKELHLHGIHGSAA
jgi:hypothetical protein